LAEQATDLVRRNVKVIATPGSTPAALAAKAATATIPIVFASGADPIGVGLVDSLNHPGGNVTGIGFETIEITGKAFELLHELLPKEARITLLIYPHSVFSASVMNKIQASATALGVRLDVLEASTDSEIEAAFAKVAQQAGEPVMLGPDAYYTSRRAQIVSFAARHAVPVMYIAREFTETGGLVSYGPDIANAYREAGTYTGRILKGEKPGDLPVALPTKFDMVINLKTARSLGIVVPDRLLALADEVIE
jgi:putative ABC transport system substrate-binding protein